MERELLLALIKKWEHEGDDGIPINGSDEVSVRISNAKEAGERSAKRLCAKELKLFLDVTKHIESQKITYGKTACNPLHDKLPRGIAI